MVHKKKTIPYQCSDTEPHESHLAGLSEKVMGRCPGIDERTIECVACHNSIKAGDLVMEVKKIRYIPEDHHPTFEIPATLAGYRHMRCPERDNLKSS